MKLLRTLAQQHIRRGFTLVETLVATGIISVVILGPLTVALNSSSYAKQTKDFMVSTYLAQEALELLRHQQESIFIMCTSGTGTNCLPDEILGETTKEAAWRLFKDRLTANSYGVSCLSAENSQGCTFDVLDMTGDTTLPFSKYSGGGSECSTLSSNVPASQAGVVPTSYLFVCGGIGGRGDGYTKTQYGRVVKMERVYQETLGSFDQQYLDDIRVTVTVSFRKPNGILRDLSLTDFLHAK